MLDLHDNAEGCDIAIRVQPNAKRSVIAGLHDQSLKVALHAPAVDGKANKALIEFLGEWLGIPRSRISITRGEKSREKTVRLHGVHSKEILSRLAGQGIVLNPAEKGRQ